MVWDGISDVMADSLYNQIANDVGNYGKFLDYVLLNHFAIK